MPPTKTVLDKVVAAITNLKDHAGSSRQAISKYLKAEFDVSNAAALKKALKTGVTKGRLIAKGTQRWTIPGATFEAPVEEQMEIKTVSEGTGAATADNGDEVTVSYVGTLTDGSKFDSAKTFKFTLGMKIGEKRKLVVPSKLGYGKRGSLPEIPGDATLLFTVVLKGIAD
eukprot:gene5528-22284_t